MFAYFAESLMRRSIPLTHLSVKYEATTNGAVSLALHNDRKQRKTASQALTKGNKICLSTLSSHKTTTYHFCTLVSVQIQLTRYYMLIG